MPQLTPHNVLKLTVAAFLASALGVWITLRNVDPDASPFGAWALLTTLCVICLTSFLAPAVYIVKKARLRGRVTASTVSASLRQSLWFSLLLAGCWALWLARALTPVTFALSALTLLLAEFAARAWAQRK